MVNLLAVPGDTVRDGALPPVPAVESVPSVAERVIGPSALRAIRVPPAELTPLARVIVVAAPALMPVPVLSVTVADDPSGARPGPVKVKLLSPLKVVTVFWN